MLIILEWMERAEEEKDLHHALTAKGLIFNPQTGHREWKPILITSYDKNDQIFTVVMQNAKNARRWEYAQTI